ncbi:MAG: hypothetical protein HONBIEJF_01386 [Fimbriimonadaceae bacterium]|nr:hypothetical protein [Fimbriimonadaceae bacterium]
MLAAGFGSLYAHQAEALNHIGANRNVVLATGTGSGKSLVFWSAASHHIVQEPMARVLAIFPTKALAQDQVQQFESWIPPEFARIGILDADTKRSHRAVIRQSSHVIATNPDMLHVGILPNHATWARFLKSLRLIVIDELHAYSGVFGAHVAGILRRLFRLANWHGANPLVVSASATILDPAGHAGRLTGRSFEAVTHDGSRKFERRIFVLDSTTFDLQATARWLGRSVIDGHKTLAFSQSRQAAEWLTLKTREFLHREGYPTTWVETYRSGLTAKDRRKTEAGFREGRILGISATSALELGIDIGSLERVLLNGYPGSRASFWQQIGRVGRGQAGEAYYLPKLDALDEYVGRTLGEIRDQPVESTPLAMDNPYVARSQLRCAAFERALAPEEVDAWSPAAAAAAETMEEDGELVRQAGRLYYPSHSNPAPQISIRGSGRDQIKLVAGLQELGTLDRSRALREAHPGAIYLHRGEKYRVVDLDLSAGVARIEADDAAGTTEPIVQHVVSRGPAAGRRGTFTLEGVTATTLVTGHRTTDPVPETVSLDLPTDSFDSIGAVTEVAWDVSAEAIHGAEHVLVAAATLLTGCHPNDLLSTWSSPSEDGPGLLAIFDASPGGNGVTESAFAELPRWLDTAASILDTCSCKAGCPSCLFSPRCPYSNEWLDKAATLLLLRGWAREI